MLSFYLSALESAADKEDFRALYRRYHGVMERTALAILQDPRDAEEAVQEAFIRVIENFSKIYEIPCKNLGAWLVTIVRNEAITMLRRRLGLTESAVNTRISRGRALLRKIFEEEGIEP